MKKFLTALFCAGMLSGCGIEYDGATKLIFEGRVTDADGQPLRNVRVSTQISDDFNLDEISYDFTDNNGHYLMIFPKPNQIADIELHLNSDSGDSAFSRTQIYNLSQGPYEDFKIDFGNSQLYNISDSVELHIAYQNVVPLKINLEGLVADNRIDYHLSDMPVIDNVNYGDTFFVRKNQVITLKYLLGNGTVHEAQITVGDEDLTYTL